MLSTDNIILKILQEAQNDGNPLLKPFIIQHPNNRVAEESNSIFVACVDSENNLEGFDFERYRDLVEILIVTKQREYSEAVKIIKGVSYEICRLIKKNKHDFPEKPVIRNVSPEYNRDFVLTRGHIMVQCLTEPINYDLSEDEYENICNIIIDKMEEE